ncbi:MAG: tRNA pseudouridine(55) synthase TruB [Polyangiaceae bacterium]|jgi:tRNA pseudouridine55 synthase
MSDERPLSGVLVIDKPRGPTSHDVVARVRAYLRTRRVGHAGTLDPMATGVLVVAIGEATKLVPWLTAHAKSYEATIALGVETDTLDADGRAMRQVDPGDALRRALARQGEPAGLLHVALEQERGRTRQVPPAYSAIRSGGERAFDRARRGETLDLAAREVRVQSLDLVRWAADPPSLCVSLTVDKGYYVRALARDLAEALGTAGHLTSLRRVRSGCFTADEAFSLETSPDVLRSSIQPLARVAARALPVTQLTKDGATDARHGRPVSIVTQTRGPQAWFAPDGELVAVGEVDDDGRGRILRGFA